jgi:iron complex outermembrane recepter protein
MANFITRLLMSVSAAVLVASPVLAENAADVSFETVVVTGKAETGYRQPEANIGPLGDKKVLDLPYTLSTLSSDFIRNQDIETFPDLAKYIPSLQQQGHPALEFGPPVVRGMLADDTSANTRIDGMNVRGDTTLPVELYDSFEVLTGPAGALYGMSYPAGMVNGVLKHPLDKPFEHLSFGYSSGSLLTASGDVNGHVDQAHRIGYRATLLYSDGEGYVDGSHRNRKVGGLTLAFKPFDSTLIEVKANSFYFRQRGFPGAFAYSGTVLLPDAPDPTTVGLGQTFGGIAAQTDIYDAKLTQHIGGDWTLTLGGLHQMSVRNFNARITNTFANNAGVYKVGYSTSASVSKVNSNIAYLNGVFDTGPVKHEVALGTNGFDLSAFGVKTSLSGTLGTSSLAAPALFATPAAGVLGARYKSSHSQEQTFVQLDTLSYGDWSLVMGLSESWLWTKNFSAAGATSSVYKANAEISETVGLTYKLRSDMSVYASYGSSIQSGGTAGTSAANSGQVLAPYRSEQYEAGYKASLAAIDLTAAVFYVERPYAAIDAKDNVYKVIGNQDDWGIELNAKGKLTDELVLFGGITWLDPRLKDLGGTNYAASDGNQVMGVPVWRTNILTEYSPAALAGLTLSFNLHYTGKRPASAENTSWAAGFVTADLGARYRTTLAEQPVVFRVGVDNLFDEHYWISINGNMDGQTGASNTAYLGTPRTFRLSLSVEN